jgi:hypothetical protein
MDDNKYDKYGEPAPRWADSRWSEDPWQDPSHLGDPNAGNPDADAGLDNYDQRPITDNKAGG